jgi:hypothetical protein
LKNLLLFYLRLKKPISLFLIENSKTFNHRTFLKKVRQKSDEKKALLPALAHKPREQGPAGNGTIAHRQLVLQPTHTVIEDFSL